MPDPLITCAQCGKRASEEYAKLRRVCPGCGTTYPGHMPLTPVGDGIEPEPGPVVGVGIVSPAGEGVLDEARAGHARRRRGR